MNAAIKNIILIFFTLLSVKTFSHSVQVAYGWSCSGDLRLYVEHWHSTENPATTTMTLELTVNGNTSTITGSPAGSVLSTTLANLAPIPPTVFAKCTQYANTYNDWVFYDFNVPCGVPVSIKIISGNTVFTEDGCGMYPAIANVCIPCPIQINVPDQTICEDGTFNAINFTPTQTPCGPVIYSWTNSNPSIGLPASGTGAIASFTPNDPGAAPQSATITVTANGCPTNGTFNLTVNPKPELIITDPLPVCEPNKIDLTNASITAGSTNLGPLTYWTNPAATNPLSNPAAVSNSATYYIQTTNAYGCSETKPVTVIINEKPILTITNPPAVCYPNTVDLTNPAIVTGTITGNGSYSYWNDAALTSPLANPNVIAVSGTYYILITTPAGCTDSKPVTVTINPLPVLNITNPPAVCQPNTIDLTAASITAGTIGAGAFTYWNDAAATSALANPNSVSVSGTYYIQITTPQGCSDIKPVVVTINPKPVLVITNPPAVCFPNTVDISATSVTNGSSIFGGIITYWQNSSTTIPLANPNAITTSGTFYIMATTAAGCSDIQPVIVTINPLPVLNITNPAAVCEPNTIDITLPIITNGTIGNGTYSYWQDAAATWPLNNATAINQSGTYYIQITTAEGCKDIQPIIVTINPAPVVNFSVDVPKGCPVHCVNFTDNSSIATNNTIVGWDWNFGDGNTANIQNPKHCYSQEGFYNVTLKTTSNRGCATTKTIAQMIEVYPKPVADFNAAPNPVSVIDPTIFFIDESSNDVISWNWNFGDGTSHSDNFTPNPSHTYPETADLSYDVILIVENNYGCRDTATKPIEIGPDFTFFIPNAFTPNGDGINDEFFGQGIGITEYEIWIYDRWGNMIFHGDEINDKWDGRANFGSEVAQQDVYVWKVALRDVFRKKHNYMGTVSLIK